MLLMGVEQSLDVGVKMSECESQLVSSVTSHNDSGSMVVSRVTLQMCDTSFREERESIVSSQNDIAALSQPM